MINAIVFGYGNVGKAVLESLKSSEDFNILGVVSKSQAGKTIDGVIFKESAEDFKNADVAILAQPSRLVPSLAKELLSKGISTVDSFDIHSMIGDVRKELDEYAKKNGKTAVTAAGWDPGTDSVIRTLFEAMAPSGITYTNFGPGMSMGHTVAVKAINGVKDALSLTIPVGTGIHRRMVYVELEDGFTRQDVADRIKKDDYFAHDETHVTEVNSVDALKDMGHAAKLERKGVSGSAQNQLFSFEMKINNPSLTAQVLVCAARAAMRQAPGCYTLIEIPPVDFLPGDRDTAVRRLV